MTGQQIWSDLGFVARLKASLAGDLNTFGGYGLTVGLCREHRTGSSLRGRALAPVLQNARDGYPPLDVPSITLASLDIHLEYSYPAPLEERFCDLMASNTDPMISVDQWLYASKIETVAVAALTVSAPEARPAFDHASGHFNPSRPRLQTGSPGNTISVSQTLLQLLDTGLQKLIISSRSRRPQTRAVGKNTLHNLPRLFPAIFNPGYREVSYHTKYGNRPLIDAHQAMNQRAASIPIISKALTSMLENSNNPIILQKKLPFLPATNVTGHPPPDNDAPQLVNTPNSAIHSALWRIAQDRTRRPVTIKRGTSFFASDPDFEQEILDEEAQPTDHLTEDGFEEAELLDLDQYDSTSHDLGSASQLMTEPLDNGITRLDEDSRSTQTTMTDDIFIYESTQATLDEVASTCDYIPFDHNDTEMLF